MKRDVAKKWVGALRSGKYKQIKGTLKRVKDNQIESFCALGVLCDLYQKEHPEKQLPEEKMDAKSKNGNEVAFAGESKVLPHKVQKWAGLKDNEVYFANEASNIPELNDHGTSFKKIADLIEKNQKDI